MGVPTNTAQSTGGRIIATRRTFSDRRHSAIAAGLIIACAQAPLAGCAWTYEKEWFANADVQIIHSGRHCKDSTETSSDEVAGSDLVLSQVHGIGRLAASRKIWEIYARQLATENDGDRSVIRPCDGEGRAFEFTQIEIWRTEGYVPRVVEEPPTPGITFAAPAGASYGARLEYIYGCLEQVGAAPGPLSTSERARVPEVDATEFLSSDRHFAGYAKIDRHFRPTRAVEPSFSDPMREDVPRLSMTLTRRDLADWAASRYVASSPRERRWFAQRYLLCLIDRGFRW